MKFLFAVVLGLALGQAHAQKQEVVSIYGDPPVGSYKTGDSLLEGRFLYVVYGERPCGLDLPYRNRMRAAKMSGQVMCALIGESTTLFKNPYMAPSSFENAAFAMGRVNADGTITIITPGYDSKAALNRSSRAMNEKMRRNTVDARLPPREPR